MIEIWTKSTYEVIGIITLKIHIAQLFFYKKRQKERLGAHLVLTLAVPITIEQANRIDDTKCNIWYRRLRV